MMDYKLQALSNLRSSIAKEEAKIRKGVNLNNGSKITFLHLHEAKPALLANWVFNTLELYETTDALLAAVSGKSDQLKDDVITLQKSRLADQLLEVKNQTTTSVQETLKSEMKSYRDAFLQETCSPVPSPVLANAVRNGFREGEKSKNIMIFGVCENESVETEESVSAISTVFQQKPHAGAYPGIFCEGVKVSGAQRRPNFFFKMALK